MRTQKIPIYTTRPVTGSLRWSPTGKLAFITPENAYIISECHGDQPSIATIPYPLQGGSLQGDGWKRLEWSPHCLSLLSESNILYHYQRQTEPPFGGDQRSDSWVLHTEPMRGVSCFCWVPLGSEAILLVGDDSKPFLNLYTIKDCVLTPCHSISVPWVIGSIHPFRPLGSGSVCIADRQLNILLVLSVSISGGIMILSDQLPLSHPEVLPILSDHVVDAISSPLSIAYSKGHWIGFVSLDSKYSVEKHTTWSSNTLYTPVTSLCLRSHLDSVFIHYALFSSDQQSDLVLDVSSEKADTTLEDHPFLYTKGVCFGTVWSAFGTASLSGPLLSSYSDTYRRNLFALTMTLEPIKTASEDFSDSNDIRSRYRQAVSKTPGSDVSSLERELFSLLARSWKREKEIFSLLEFLFICIFDDPESVPQLSTVDLDFISPFLPEIRAIISFLLSAPPGPSIPWYEYISYSFFYSVPVLQNYFVTSCPACQFSIPFSSFFSMTCPNCQGTWPRCLGHLFAPVTLYTSECGIFSCSTCPWTYVHSAALPPCCLFCGSKK